MSVTITRTADGEIEVPQKLFVVGPSRPHRNTSLPPSRAKVERAIVGIERHLTNNPHDTAASRRLAVLRERLERL